MKTRDIAERNSQLDTQTLHPRYDERERSQTVFAILAAISLSHLFNDTIQSLLMGLYPVLKQSFSLSYGQIGWLTFAFMITASVLQPVVGYVTDRSPRPFTLMFGMGLSFAGLLILAYAPSYAYLLVAAILIGLGSAVFHPEASRIARLASGRRPGFAQAFFQVGGSTGTALGPLLAALIVVPYGQSSIVWFSVIALAALFLLYRVSDWHRAHPEHDPRRVRSRPAGNSGLSTTRTTLALVVLGILVFSKFFYLESFRGYYTFFLIERFEVSIRTAQILLFVQLLAIAAGALIGGAIGDRIGRKRVIWASILGILPLTLLLPHVGLLATVGLTIPISMGIASAFPAIIVYAQDLLPGRTGMISGLFFGLAFGMGGLGAAILGHLADLTSVEYVFRLCAFLPALGLLTAFLPNLGQE